jgi:hypothetical protein
MIADKIGPHHLERKAILYVRQSSAHQVLHNRPDWRTEPYLKTGGVSGEQVSVHVPEGHGIGKLELPSDITIFGFTFLRKGKRALVFVYGFNTKFRDAVFRTAQIVWDLNFGSTTVLFSWPSHAGFDDIDVIAHSMGNLIAVDALSNNAATQSPTAIAQLVMAAPDIDRDMFIQGIP